MASILKVDTLQKPDGSTPTAADLGLNVAGSIVQMYQYAFDDETLTSSGAYSGVTNSAFTFTPKYATSTLVITAELAANFWLSASNAGWSFRINHDGTVISKQNQVHEFYDNSSGSSYTDIYDRHVKSASVPAGTTDGRTIYLDIASYNGASVKINQGGNWRSFVTVYEIAQ